MGSLESVLYHFSCSYASDFHSLPLWPPPTLTCSSEQRLSPFLYLSYNVLPEKSPYLHALIYELNGSPTSVKPSTLTDSPPPVLQNHSSGWPHSPGIQPSAHGYTDSAVTMPKFVSLAQTSLLESWRMAVFGCPTAISNVPCPK